MDTNLLQRIIEEHINTRYLRNPAMDAMDLDAIAKMHEGEKPPETVHRENIESWLCATDAMLNYPETDAVEHLLWPLFLKPWLSCLVGWDAPKEWRVDGGFEMMVSYMNYHRKPRPERCKTLMPPTTEVT